MVRQRKRAYACDVMVLAADVMVLAAMTLFTASMCGGRVSAFYTGSLANLGYKSSIAHVVTDQRAALVGSSGEVATQLSDRDTGSTRRSHVSTTTTTTISDSELTGSGPTLEPKSGIPSWQIIVPVVLVIVVGLICLVICFCLRYYKRRHHSSTKSRRDEALRPDVGCSTSTRHHRCVRRYLDFPQYYGRHLPIDPYDYKKAEEYSAKNKEEHNTNESTESPMEETRQTRFGSHIYKDPVINTHELHVITDSSTVEYATPNILIDPSRSVETNIQVETILSHPSCNANKSNGMPQIRV